MRAAWRNSVKLAHADARVLLALAWFANDDGYAWPAQSTVAELVGMDVGNVRRRIAELDACGLVDKLERRKLPGRRGLGTWVYRLAVDNAVNTASPLGASDDVTTASPPRGRQRRLARGSARLARGYDPDLRVVAGRAESLDSELEQRARAREGDYLDGRCNACGDRRRDCGCASRCRVCHYPRQSTVDSNGDVIGCRCPKPAWVQG